MKNKKAPFKGGKIVVLLASLAVFALGLIFVISSLLNSNTDFENNESTLANATSSKEEVQLVDNPINFAEESKKYPDIYAWINIPNTNINYPVVQHPTKDDFYLKHNAEQKATKSGAIYSELKNSKDFSDKNTVLYGHNMLNGSMFRDLHKFRKEDKFFEENKYVYIYTPGHILTYKIFAAYKTDNRHILKTFDFSDPVVFKKYLEKAQNPTTLGARSRDIELNENSKILTLSTCIGDKNYRYLVQGVLVKDEATK